MAVKKVGDESGLYQYAICYGCSAVLEYSPEDVQRETSPTRNPHVRSYKLTITCPGCQRKVPVK